MDKQTALQSLHAIYTALRKLQLTADEHELLRKHAITVEMYIDQAPTQSKQKETPDEQQTQDKQAKKTPLK